MSNTVDNSFIDSFYAAWNAHDVEALLGEHMTDDVVFESAGGPEAYGQRWVGAEAVGEALRSYFEAVPDVRWEPTSTFIGDGHAVIEFVTSGTPEGGTPYRLHGCSVLELRDGRVSADRAYRKSQQ